ncbi:MAG: preprotein translocase subunit YajC [Candidatus Omnitrophica bacterium]|nr:preprotein translocase subunit YajC [Candidatus Omnitrophota bacterium]
MPQQSSIPMLLMWGALIAIWYFILIRPEQQKRKEHQATLADLKKNDEVIAAGGIHGVVVNVKDKTVVLRLDENCRVEFEKDSIVAVTKKAE